MSRKANPANKQKRNERKFFMVEKTPETTALIALIRELLTKDTPGATVPDAGVLREGLYTLAFLLLKKGTTFYLPPVDRNWVLVALRKANTHDGT